MAITNDHVEMARFLIDKGANVKVVDWYGRTPLWAAVETRNMDVDNSTFENGVDRAPVFELIKVLLDKGVDVNARTKETPPIRRQMLRITGVAVVGRLHRADAVSHGALSPPISTSCGCCSRTAPIRKFRHSQARRR